VSLPAPPNAMGPPRDEGYSVPRRNIRPGQAASPRRTAASAVGGMGYQGPVPGHLSPFGWDHLASGRAVSLVAFVAPWSGDGAIADQRVPPRQQMRAALQLCSARRRLQEVKQCLTTPGTYGIFEC
jgi:hypothetical protein